MAEKRLSERLWLLLTALLVITVPALTLVLAYAVLLATRSALANQFTPVEILELYLVEVVAFALFGYLLYRLLRYGLDRGTDEPAEALDAEPAGPEAPAGRANGVAADTTTEPGRREAE
jgi:uncharacterized membrane protein